MEINKKYYALISVLSFLALAMEMWMMSTMSFLGWQVMTHQIPGAGEKVIGMVDADALVGSFIINSMGFSRWPGSLYLGLAFFGWCHRKYGKEYLEIMGRKG